MGNYLPFYIILKVALKKWNSTWKPCGAVQGCPIFTFLALRKKKKASPSADSVSFFLLVSFGEHVSLTDMKKNLFLYCSFLHICISVEWEFFCRPIKSQWVFLNYTRLFSGFRSFLKNSPTCQGASSKCHADINARLTDVEIRHIQEMPIQMCTIWSLRTLIKNCSSRSKKNLMDLLY